MIASEVQNMQNQPEKKPSAFKKFLRDKGYYMVLVLCVVAVGVSGYLFVRTAADQNRAELQTEPSLSVPLTPSGVERGNSPIKGQTKTPVKATDKTAEDSTGKTPTDDAAEAVAQEPVSLPTAPMEETPVTTVRPLSGDTIGEYSMTALSFNETTRDWRTHDGIDIAAEAGAQVAAARAGTVSGVYEDPSLGTTVEIRHDDGYVTRYSNLSEETAVTAGQTVEAGQVLGTVGGTATTELAAASHLHFSAYLDGTPVDPAEFFGG